jgi:hypothetical protein
MIPEIIFRATLPMDKNGWGGFCEIQKRGKKYRVQFGDKIDPSIGKNHTGFHYQTMTSMMKEADIIPEIDRGSEFGFYHMTVRRQEWHESLKSCESAYNSSVIQYSIKETAFTEAYDQKHGITTRYYGEC